jgi:hypothetical protein
MAINDVRTTVDSITDRPFLYGQRLLRAGGQVVKATAARMSEIVGRDVREPGTGANVNALKSTPRLP